MTGPATAAPQTAVAESTRPAPTRRPAASRKAPVLAINYDYLTRDLRHLAILAPAMIVLVIIAFFIFH